MHRNCYLAFCLGKCFWEKASLHDEISYEKAIYYYKIVGEEGNAIVQYWLGNAFLSYKYGAYDPRKAVYWYKLSAKQGVVLANYHLAICYLFGIGTDTDENKAYDYFLVAARNNHKESISFLITLLENNIIENDSKNQVLNYWKTKYEDIVGAN